MKYFTILFCLLIICFYSCAPTTEDTKVKESTPHAESVVSDTEQAINELVEDAYKVISFEKGSAPDYVAMKALFTPQATLYNFREDSLKFYFIDEFIEEFKSGLFAGEMLAFNEIELGGETEYFGKMGHRISAYASYFDGADIVGEKGVNSFQVLNVNGKWLINSIIWDIEKPGQSIPDRYLD